MSSTVTTPRKGKTKLEAILSNYERLTQLDCHDGRTKRNLYLVSIPNSIELSDLNGVTIKLEDGFSGDITLADAGQPALEYKSNANPDVIKHQVIVNKENSTNTYLMKSLDECVTFSEKLSVEIPNSVYCLPRPQPPLKPTGMKRRLKLFGGEIKAPTSKPKSRKNDLMDSSVGELNNTTEGKVKLDIGESGKSPKKKKKKQKSEKLDGYQSLDDFEISEPGKILKKEKKKRKLGMEDEISHEASKTGKENIKNEPKEVEKSPKKKKKQKSKKSDHDQSLKKKKKKNRNIRIRNFD